MIPAGGPTATPTTGSPPRFRLPRGFAAFRHRNYRLYFIGQLISVTGTWMQTLAQSWLILSLTTSPFMLGLVSVFQFAPVLALGLIGGVAADRFPKRTTLVFTKGAAGVVSGIMATLIWTGAIQIWHVYALALILGTVNAFDMPARQAFVVEMVGPEDLTNAIALNSSLFNAARIVGPAIAGVLLATVGAAACFAIDAVSYIAVIAGLLMMRLEPRRPAMAGSQLERLREGLSFVRRTPNIYLPILLIGLTATFGMNFNVWVPLLAKQDLGVGASGFGLLMSSLGVGSLTGALSVAFLRRLPPWGAVLATALALGALEVLLALGVPLFPILILMAILAGLGFSMTTTSAMANSRVQATSPDALRGRVMSVYTTIFAGTAPFGALLAGGVANGMGAPGSLAICGAATVGSVALIAVLGHAAGVSILPRAERHSSALEPGD
jgi:predicted MFS family arabinose efflux permease